jgi:hypothetical protein
MRNNQPVTDIEYVLRDDQSPISRTDLEGNITLPMPISSRPAGILKKN